MAMGSGEVFAVSISEDLLDLRNEIAHLENFLGRVDEQSESR